MKEDKHRHTLQNSLPISFNSLSEKNEKKKDLGSRIKAHPLPLMEGVEIGIFPFLIHIDQSLPRQGKYGSGHTL